VVAGALALAFLVAACGLAGPSSAPPASPGETSAPPPSPGETVAPPSPGETVAPPTSSPPSPTASAGSTPTEAPTPTPEPTPTEAVGPTPSGSAAAATTAACFGSSDTRDFFSSFAESVPWPVYCAVLPAGWSVEKGSYRLRDGGRLTISFRRRADGARLVLDEGTVCLETTPCVGPGLSLGTTPLSDREAELSVVDGSLTALVDGTENPAWLLTGTGIEETEFRGLAAALHLIDE
jgi:hypothetical protein